MKTRFIRFTSLILSVILLVLSTVACSSSKKGIICRECDEKNPMNAIYCAECGSKLKSSDNNDTSNNDSDKSGSNDKWLLHKSYVPSTGVTITYYYDSNGYLVGQESIRENGEMITCTYYTNDSHGNCIEQYLPLYEQLGFNSHINFKNTYDNNGNLTRSYNEDWGGYDQYYYDGDELVKIVEIDSDGEETSVKEYENGKLISITEDGETAKLKYNSKGKCTGTDNKNVKADEHGNITSDSFYEHTYITLEDYKERNLHVNDYVNYNSNSGGNNSGGNNSGGNNSGGNSSPSICSACNGSGQGRECIGCDGSGQALSYYDINDRPVYRTCSGCSGRGYIKCAYCGGDGYR